MTAPYDEKTIGDDGRGRVRASVPGADCADGLRMLRAMLMIRRCEDKLMRLPRPGFQLLSSGEEAVAVGVCTAMQPGDTLLSSGRSIGPALARGLAPATVLGEVLGKATGPCKGKGGRGHIADPAAGFFGAHAVVGGNVTIAAGVALAARMLRPGQVVVCIFGDGACGSGSIGEAMNFASLWKLPLVLVCNNNQYSVSTPVREAIAAARLADLAAPFRVPAATVDGLDVCAVRQAAAEMIERARSGHGPAFLECVSYRFATHSTASRESRPVVELAFWRARCPIENLASRLCERGMLSAARLADLRAKVDAESEAAACAASAAPYPDPREVALADVL